MEPIDDFLAAVAQSREPRPAVPLLMARANVEYIREYCRGQGWTEEQIAAEIARLGIKGG